MVPRGLASNYCERVRMRIYTVLDHTRNKISTCTLHKDKEINKTTYVSLNFQDRPFPEVAVKTGPVEAEE